VEIGAPIWAFGLQAELLSPLDVAFQARDLGRAGAAHYRKIMDNSG
jgi:hypothetical protein